MTDPLKAFTEHEIHNTVKEIITYLAQIDNESEIMDKEKIETTNNVKVLIEKIDSKLDRMDPFLTTKDKIDLLNNSLKELMNNLDSYMTSEETDAGQKKTIDKSTNTIKSNIIYLIDVIKDDDIIDLRNSLSTYNRSLGQYKKNVETELDFFNKQSAELKNKIKSGFADLDGKVSELQNRIKDQLSRIDEVIDEYKQTMSNEQVNQVKEFEKTRHKFKDELNRELQLYKDELNEYRINTLQKYEEELEEHKERIEKTVNATAGTSKAGGYQKEADKEGKKLIVFNTLTYVFIIGAIIAGYYFLFQPQDVGTDVNAYIIRTIIIAPLAYGIYYSTKQTENHIKGEKLYRKLELELSALQPYIATLDIGKQKDITEALVNKYFTGCEKDEELINKKE